MKDGSGTHVCIQESPAPNPAERAAEAEEVCRAKTEFLSRVSHEMLTPMNAIMGMAQIAKISGGPSATMDCVDEIGRASKQLLRMIHDLLDMSDLTRGGFRLCDSVFSVDAMLESILKEARGKAAEKGQTILYAPDPQIPAALVGDEKRLAQALANLLANAVKFTPEGGEIRLSVWLLSSEGDKAVLQIEVADNGIGIPAEMQNAIFRTFEQADGGAARKHGGVGLGLSLSKHIAEMMGGEIRIESKPGQGAKVSFTCKLGL